MSDALIAGFYKGMYFFHQYFIKQQELISVSHILFNAKFLSMDMKTKWKAVVSVSSPVNQPQGHDMNQKGMN